MISVVIPVYKNREQFSANIRHNLKYLDQCEIIVVNDDPSSSIKSFLPKGNILLIENKKNLGFAGAVNTGVEKTRNRFVMLLNSDVLLNDTSYLKAVSIMENDKNLFAVSFAQSEKNGAVVGKNSIYWKDGFFQHRKADNLTAGINGWAEGGACIVDKEKFNSLGGFDTLFSPFYWEDVDLSYRAWANGFHVLFEPGIRVVHHHESTIKQYFSNRSIHQIAYRNQFIFIWKNISDRRLILSHILNLMLTLPVSFIKNRTLVRGFCLAFAKLPFILSKRRTAKISDTFILKKFI